MMESTRVSLLKSGLCSACTATVDLEAKGLKVHHFCTLRLSSGAQGCSLAS